MKPPILNVADAEYTDLAEQSRRMGSEMPSERYGGRMASLSRPLGAHKLGYNVTVIAPGKCAFPFHSHRVNEEMFFVLEGTGELRYGETRYPLRAGDIVACPPGGAETAHQIVNIGETELRVFAVSTNETPEICGYPDSGKFGVLAHFDPDASGRPQFFTHIGRTEDTRDYWEGE